MDIQNDVIGLVLRENYKSIQVTDFIAWPSRCHDTIDKIEQVQKRATKQIPEMKNLNYEERLRKLKLPTLGYRRVRGDMIEMYKIIKGKYDKSVITLVKTAEESEVRHSTRTNTKTIVQLRANTELGRKFFSIRVANVCRGGSRGRTRRAGPHPP